MADERVDADSLIAELARRVAAEGSIASSLVDLEQHPGHRLLSTTPLTGRTAERWSAARDLLARTWQDFTAYRSVTAAAAAVRDRRARPGEPEVAELRKLLREPTVEVARTVVERRITGDVERVETITLDELTTRMNDAFREVTELVETCGSLHQAFIDGLAPLAERLRAAREAAAELSTGLSDPDVAAVAALTARVNDLDRACSADPLSLGGKPPAQVLSALDKEIDALATRLARLKAVRDGWDTRLREIDAADAEVASLRQQEQEARIRAQELIAGTALYAPPDRTSALRDRRAALASVVGWSQRARALDELHAAVGTAVSELREALELATGLIDRRTELRGRFDAYQARATRLGYAEDPELMTLTEDIRRMLWTRPCDLAAATRALSTYQQRLRDAAATRPA
jgi:hypothetical protein